MNLIWKDATLLRLDQLNEMDKFCLLAYERYNLYKERMKLYHDWQIEKSDFQIEDLVLLFGSRFKLLQGN